MTTTPEQDTTDWTPIIVQGPLPMDVAGTLMKLIGAAYPTAVIDGSGKHTPAPNWRGHATPALVMVVNPKDRAKHVTKKAAAELKDHDDGTGSEFLAFKADEDGVVLSLRPPEDLVLELGAMAHVIFQAMAGENYIEWGVRTKVENAADARYVLSVARSKEQTPHALRMRAEKDLEDLRALVRVVSARADKASTPDEWQEVAAHLRDTVGE